MDVLSLALVGAPLVSAAVFGPIALQKHLAIRAVTSTAEGTALKKETEFMWFLMLLFLVGLSCAQLIAGTSKGGGYTPPGTLFTFVSVLLTILPLAWYLHARRTRRVPVKRPIIVSDYVWAHGAFNYVPGKTEVQPLPYSVNVKMRGTKQNREEWEAVAYVTIADFAHRAFVRLSDVENDIRDVLGKVGAKETTAEAIAKRLTEDLPFCTEAKVILTTTAKHKKRT